MRVRISRSAKLRLLLSLLHMVCVLQNFRTSFVPARRRSSKCADPARTGGHDHLRKQCICMTNLLRAEIPPLADIVSWCSMGYDRRGSVRHSIGTSCRQATCNIAHTRAWQSVMGLFGRLAQQKRTKQTDWRGGSIFVRRKEELVIRVSATAAPMLLPRGNHANAHQALASDHRKRISQFIS